MLSHGDYSLGLRSSTNYCQIMVAERKRVDRLNLRISTPEGVPLPFYRRGSTSTHTKRRDLLVHLGNGLSKPTDDVGQQLNDKFKVGFSHSSKIEKISKIKDTRYVLLQMLF